MMGYNGKAIHIQPMKIICSQSDLNANISHAARAVPSRPSHPVLGNLLLIADGDTQRVALRGFDLGLGIETRFEAEVTQGGRITLPAKTIGDIISRLPDGEVTIIHEPDEDGGLVTITSVSGRYQLRSLDADEFPELPQIEGGYRLTLPVEQMKGGLKAVLFAASTEETKQVLTGVHLTITANSLEFAATDGHRLAILESSGDGESEPTEATIPARAFRELERLLGQFRGDDEVIISMNEAQATFALGTAITLTSRKLEGAYPRYRQLLPTAFLGTVHVDRRAFAAALDRISVLADSRNNVVVCRFDQGNQTLAMSVEAQDVGSGVESMTAQIEGEVPERVAFSTHYLSDAVKGLSSGEMTLHLNKETQPVIITPLSGAKVTHLIMPVQLRD